MFQDQMRALKELCIEVFGPTKAPMVDVYDGDSLRGERGEIRDRVQLLITNPDMLHMSILPVHWQFARLLANLRFVVLDEGHAYRSAVRIPVQSWRTLSFLIPFCTFFLCLRLY